MNPRTDYESVDKETARAFMNLFIEHGDMFKFAIDSQVSDDEEIRAHVIAEDNVDTDDGKSTICITGINQTETVNKISNIMKEMGLEIIREEEKEQTSEFIGEYISNQIVAYAPENIDAKWNVPHLIIYGSLSPEVEEACYTEFGSKYSYNNVRNHYIVSGEGLTEQDKYSLASAIDSGMGFEDDKRFNKSQVHQGELV